jgi:hypothetical protein
MQFDPSKHWFFTPNWNQMRRERSPEEQAAKRKYKREWATAKRRANPDCKPKLNLPPQEQAARTKQLRREREKTYRARPEDKKKRAEYNQAYNAANHDKLVDLQRQYRVENPEKVKQNRRKHVAANAEKIKVRRRKWSAEHPAIKSEYNRRWRDKNKGYFDVPARRLRKLVIHAKFRAKKAGIAFEESLFEIVIPPECPCCGLPFDFKKESARWLRSPSLDRLDSREGYTAKNTGVLCWRCNSLKKDATLDELEKLVAYVRARSAF